MIKEEITAVLDEKELSGAQKDKMDQDGDGDIDKDDLKALRNKKKKKVPHSWATHGRKASDKSKQIGEVIEHSLTESGKIDRYKVRFGNRVEIIEESDFIVEQSKMHEHEIKEI